MTDTNSEFQLGLKLKAQGDFDKALTAFRRAVIQDSKHTESYMEIGRMCRDKARLDPVFLRYAFEAFRSAARLDLNSQEAHDQYIMLAQQMKILDQIHDEYETWSKQHPNNDVIQKSYKNLVAISMAMFSPQVQVGGAQASGSMKKMIFFVALFSLLVGAGLIFAPPLFSKSGKISKDQLKSFFTVGLVLCIGGLGGLLFHRQLD